MTHEYIIGFGGWIQPSIDRPGEMPSTAIAWAADHILAVGPDDAVRAISQGDSTFLDLAGAVVTALPSDPERALALVSELAPEQAASRLAELLIEAGCLGADGVLEPGSRADLAFWRVPSPVDEGDAPREISLIGVVRAGEFTHGHPRRGSFAPIGHHRIDARPSSVSITLATMPEQIIPEVGTSIAGVVDIIDPRGSDSIDAEATLTRLTDGGTWAEGPVYLPGEVAVMYSDVPQDRATIWTATEGGRIWRQPNDFTNGNTLDREGRIVHCEHGNRRIARTESDGTRHSVVDRFEGRRLNSPNDVVVKSDGTIWFTDPPYGIRNDREGHAAPQEQSGCFVYRYDPSSDETSVVSDAVEHPNGLAFSPDETRLYVSDTSAVPESGASQQPTGNHHVVVFDVIDGRRLGEPRVLVVMEPGLADGLRVDERGDIWSSAADGIHLLDPEGRDLARIRVPEVTSNCVFGGPDGRRLFITASSSLYAIGVKVRGAGVAAAVARGERPG